MANYKAGTGTADDLRRIQQAMVAAADAAKAELPELSELRARVQTRIDALIARGRVLATDIQPVDLDVAATSVKVWAHVLENHTLAGIKTETDWLRPKYSLNDDVVVAGSPSNLVDIQKRLLRILADLKVKASSGTGTTQVDFDQLKAEMYKTAFGPEASERATVEADPIIEKALDAMPKAKALLENAKKVLAQRLAKQTGTER